MQMAHAFDNRNFIPGKPQTFYSVSSPAQADRKNTLWETSSSPRPNHPPPSYEESVLNRQSSNDSTYHQRQQPIADDYFTFTLENRNSDTKPPRITAMTNNNYIRRSNILPQCSTNGMKTSTTYLNTTQLYITQPSSEDPPTIPPRNLPTCYQKSSVTIPDFNSSLSSKAIYRSPAVKQNDHSCLEQQLNSLSIDNNHHIRDITNESTAGEYFGECRKCGETLTSLDDPCDILGQIYHSSCAVCVLCGRSVKNKHFFVKDQLYCEEDFLYTGFHQTLENCVACNHLITDTVLQALGQSYHVTCFKCSKCSMCLDGMPFITDKKRNLFCLNDYHMTYAPRCDKCSKPICPEDNSNETVKIVSMGKTFHVQCYKCEDCSMQLGDEQDRRCYPLDDTLLCQDCCLRRFVSVNKF